MIPAIKARDEREEPPPRSEEAVVDTGAVGEGEGEAARSAASGLTVPTALTSSRTFVHVTVDASVRVDAPAEEMMPPWEASTISEA